jgi:hypothetical protein
MPLQCFYTAVCGVLLRYSDLKWCLTLQLLDRPTCSCCRPDLLSLYAIQTEKANGYYRSLKAAVSRCCSDRLRTSDSVVLVFWNVFLEYLSRCTVCGARAVGPLLRCIQRRTVTKVPRLTYARQDGRPRGWWRSNADRSAQQTSSVLPGATGGAAIRGWQTQAVRQSSSPNRTRTRSKVSGRGVTSRLSSLSTFWGVACFQVTPVGDMESPCHIQ